MMMRWVPAVFAIAACGDGLHPAQDGGPPGPHTVGGTVTGIRSSAGLILQDNGGDDLPLFVDGPFTFATPVTSPSTYDVSVHQQPDGEVCRVDNASGTIGSADVTDVVVTCGHLWTTLATSAATACGLHQDGTLWCWGGSYDEPVDRPTDVTRSMTWTSIAVSAGLGGMNFGALAGDGSLWCWGDNTYGQLGTGPLGYSSSTPAEIPSTTPWLAIDLGGSFVCGIKSDGTLWCWGRNDKGQVGDGTWTTKHVPTQVGAASDWSAVSAGDYHACGIKRDGSLWCWGANNGALGDGTLTAHGRPEQIGTDSWRSVSAGDLHTCGIKSDGTVWCWGKNHSGQLGDGTMTSSTTPVQAGTSSAWATVAAGDGATCGTRTDGTLWCWGSRWLGDGTSAGSATPLQIASFTSWAAVAPTTSFTCALAADRSLWCWGEDFAGQLGDGHQGDSAPSAVLPQEVP